MHRQLGYRIHQSRMDAYTREAARSGATVSDWVRGWLNRAAVGDAAPGKPAKRGRAIDFADESRARLALRIEASQVATWEAAAARCNLPLQAWITAVLDEASGISELAAQLEKIRS